MEMRLDSLIEKIKEEGISEAKKSSEKIIQGAEERKRAIIQEAKERAGIIIKGAEERAGKLKDNSQKAITQAVRDVILSLKEQIKNLFDATLKREIQHTLSDGFIKELILRIAEVGFKDREAALEISLNQKDKERLEGLILSKLKEELKQGITFKANPNINKGFRIGLEGEDFFYDITDEAIQEILKEYLRPFILRIIK
jgi:V/A-type H+-transporting ATPase subunit E